MDSFPYRGQPILSKALFALYGSSYGDYNRECKEIKKERHRKDMKKVVLFFILNQFADWEAAYLSSALRSLGKDRYIVKTVSLTKDKVQSIGGFQILPDYDISSMPEEYEAFPVPVFSRSGQKQPDRGTALPREKQVEKDCEKRSNANRKKGRTPVRGFFFAA